MRITVTGASGLIGRRLVRKLITNGHEVRALVRHPKSLMLLPDHQVFAWTDAEVPPPESLRGVDAVVHLAGESIAGVRWTDAAKARLRESRVRGTENLARAWTALAPAERPKTLICASAVGLYGDQGETMVTEDTRIPADGGFLSDLVRDWEDAARKVETLGVRVARTRFGVVLAREGGALPKMSGVTLGSGRQWMSWIHIDDVIGFIKHAINNSHIKGAYNLTSPRPLRARQMSAAIAERLKIPLTVHVPEFALRLALGEMSQVLLCSQKIQPERVLQSGYSFLFPGIEEALKDIYDDDTYLDQHFEMDQFLPVDKRRAFHFFAQVENLEAISPPWLDFHVTEKPQGGIHQGSEIGYRFRFHGVPVNSRGTISLWEPERRFVDEQLQGPYEKWRHVHTFDEVPGGTLLRDDITYRLRGAAIGRFFLGQWIGNEMRRTFSFRRDKIARLLSSPASCR